MCRFRNGNWASVFDSLQMGVVAQSIWMDNSRRALRVGHYSDEVLFFLVYVTIF